MGPPGWRFATARSTRGEDHLDASAAGPVGGLGRSLGGRIALVPGDLRESLGAGLHRREDLLLLLLASPQLRRDPLPHRRRAAGLRPLLRSAIAQDEPELIPERRAQVGCPPVGSGAAIDDRDLDARREREGIVEHRELDDLALALDLHRPPTERDEERPLPERGAGLGGIRRGLPWR